MSLLDILSAADRAPDGFDADIPDGWLQGRTAYGGLSAALALEAARKASPDMPPLRSAQISYVGPLAGRVSVRAQQLRRGKNAAFVRCDVSSEAGLGLSGMFVFMNALESHVDVDLSSVPDIGGPRPNEEGHGVVPNFFTNNFNWSDAWPRPAEPEPDVSRWVQLKERAGLDPMVELIAIGDALPPAAMPLMKQWGPISTMTWLVNLLTPEPQTRDGWWLIRATASFARNGCSSQAMHIWNADGKPIATAMQSVALFV